MRKESMRNPALDQEAARSFAENLEQNRGFAGMMSSSSSSDLVALPTESSPSQVQFRMTVKVDIEGHVPASSSSNPDAVQSAYAAVANSTTQDLLLKLQPLLPHLCIKTASASTSKDEAEKQEQQRNAQPGGDESLELSLGLSLSNQTGGGGGGGGGGACDQISSWQNLGKAEREDEVSVVQQQQRHAGLGKAESVDWRIVEQQRLKREVQCQKRQEARKKRRILIDEQKQQKKQQHQQRKSPCLSVSCNSDPHLPHNWEEDPKSVESSLPAAGIKGGLRRRRRTRCKLLSSASTMLVTNKVKSEVEEEDNNTFTGTTATGGGGAVRPSPVHETSHEWVQKFMEMQKMVKLKRTSSAIADESHERLQSQFQTQETEGDGESSLEKKTKRAKITPPVCESMDLQSGSLCSTRGPSLAASAFSPVVLSSTGAQQSGHWDPTAYQDGFKAPDRAALLRTASLGTFLPKEQQSHSIRMPSPIRCSGGSNSSLLRTLSEGAAMRARLNHSSTSDDQQQQERVAAAGRRDQQQEQHRLVNRSNKNSAFKSPKKESVDRAAPTTTNCETSMRSRPVDLPWVTTTGTGPNGTKVSGVLLAYKKGEVRIVCSCHGHQMTAKEFVEHAGGVEVANPEKFIVVSPSKSLNSDSKSFS